jgi:hypothetical protein
LSVSFVAHDSTSWIMRCTLSVGFLRNSFTVAVSSCSWTCGPGFSTHYNMLLRNV